MKTRPLIDLLVRRRRFRWFFVGLLSSRIGDTFHVIALSWLTLQIAGPAELGVLLLLGGIPGVISAPIAGHLVDRYGARLMLIIDNVTRAGIVSTVPLLIWTESLQIEYLYGVAFLTGLLATTTEIGQMVVVPALVDDEELDAANTLVSVIWDLSAWAGPALAGIVVQLAGAATAFTVDAVTFLIMGATATALPGRLRQETDVAGDAATSRGAAGTLSGFTELWRLRPVAALTTVALGVLLLTGALEVFFPTYAKEWLNVGAGGYGLLMSVAGLCSLLGTVLLTPRLGRLRPGVALAAVLTTRAVFLLPLVFTRTLPVAVIAVGISSAADGPFYPLNRSLMQRQVPEHLRGRVFGAMAAITSAGFPLGAALTGLLLVVVSPNVVVAVIAAAFLPLGALVLLVPELMRLPPVKTRVTEEPIVVD